MALDLQMPPLHVEHQIVRVLYLTVYGAQLTDAPLHVEYQRVRDLYLSLYGTRLTDAPVACGTSACMCFESDGLWSSTYRCLRCMWNISLYVFCICHCMVLGLQMLLLHVEHQAVRVLYPTVYGA
jgi:hypothetical protein